MAEETRNGALGISANIDTGNSSKNAQEFVKDIDKMEKAADGLAKTIDETEKYLKSLGISVVTSGKELKESLSKAIDAVKKYSEGAEQSGVASEAVTKALDDFNKRMSAVPQAISTVNEKIASLRRENEDLQESLNGVAQGTEEYDILNKRLQINNTTLYNNQKLASELSSAYDDIKETIGGVGITYEYLSSAVNTATNSTSNSNVARQTNASLISGQISATTEYAETVNKESEAHIGNAQSIGQEQKAMESLADVTQNLGESEAIRANSNYIDELTEKIEKVKANIAEANTEEDRNRWSERLVELNALLDEAKKKQRELNEEIALSNGTPVSGPQTPIPQNISDELQQKIYELHNIKEQAGRALAEGVGSEQDYKDATADLEMFIDAVKQGATTVEEAEEIIYNAQSERSNAERAMREEQASATQKELKRKELEGKSIAELQARYGALSEEIRRLNAETDALRESGDNAGAGKLFDDVTKLQEEADIIKDILKSKGEDTQGNAVESLQKQFRALKEEAGQLTLQYRSLSDEEKKSDFGEKLRQRMDDVTKKAGDLKDAIGDVQRAINADASDTKAFDAMAEGIDTVVSGIGAAIGVEGLFAENEEELIALQTKLQGVLTISNGLKTIQNNLQKESNLMVGIGNIQETARQAAIGLTTAAESKSVVVRWAAVAAQKALNIVAAMNPYVALALAITTVVGVLWAWVEADKAAKEEEEKKNEELKKSLQKAKEITQAYDNQVQSHYNAASSINHLRVAYKQANTELAKTAILEQAQTEFKKLGIECKNTADAQKILVEQGDAVVKMLILEGNVAALSALRMEAFKKSFNMLRENGYDTQTATILAGANKKVRALDAEITKMKNEANAIKHTLPQKTIKHTLPQKTKKDTNTDANNLTNANEKLESTERQNARERAKVVSDMERMIADAKVAAMEEGAKKALQSRIRANEKELENLDRQRDEAIEAEKQRQKKLFEAQQDIVKAKGGKVEKWSESMVDNSFIEKIKEQYAIIKDDVIKKQKRAADSNAIPDELKSYELKRDELAKKWDEVIEVIREQLASETDAGKQQELQKAIVNAETQRAKELLDLDFKKLTESPEYVRAFENLNRTSTETLNSLLKKFQEVKASAGKNLRPDELKAFTDAIEKMNEAFIERDPFKALVNSFKRVKESAKELREAESILRRVQSGEKIITGTSLDKATNKIVATYLTEEQAQQNVTDKANANNSALNDNEKAVQKAVGMVTDALNQLADSIGGVAGEIMKSVSSLASSISSNYKALQDGGPQGWMAAAQISLQAITSGMSIVMGMATKYEKASIKQDKINDITDAVRAYRDAIREARQEENEWFAKTGIKSLRDSWEDSIDAVENYNAKLNEQQVEYQDAKSGLSRTWSVIAAGVGGAIYGAIVGGPWGMAIGAVAGTAVGVATQVAMNSASESVGKMVRAQDNLRVQTQHKTFFRSEKTEDLQSWIYNNMQSTARKLGVSLQLFKQNGELNLELAKAVLDSGATLVGQTKETLEELIAYQEQIEEYHKQLQDYVSQLYSPLLDNMNNALWDWFEEGKDAMDAFYDYASDTFKKVGQELTKDMINQFVFDGLKDQLKDVTANYVEGKISDEEYAKQIADVTSLATQKFEDTLPKLQNFLENYDTALDNVGIDITRSAGEAQGAVNGAMSVTEDTGNQIVGRITAMQLGVERQTMSITELMSYSIDTYNTLSLVQEDTSAIRNSMASVYENITEIRDIQERSASTLVEIATNTAQLYEMNDKLSDISRKLDS